MSVCLSLSLVLKTDGSLSFHQLNTYTERPLNARLADSLLLLWALSVDRALPNLEFGFSSLL